MIGIIGREKCKFSHDLSKLKECLEHEENWMFTHRITELVDCGPAIRQINSGKTKSLQSLLLMEDRDRISRRYGGITTRAVYVRSKDHEQAAARDRTVEVVALDLADALSRKYSIEPGVAKHFEDKIIEYVRELKSKRKRWARTNYRHAPASTERMQAALIMQARQGPSTTL